MPVPSDGLLAWYDADNIDQADDTQVETWSNTTNPGTNDATQTTSANRPILKHNVLHEHKSVRFNGANSFLTTPFLFNPSSSEYTIAVLFKTSASTGSQDIVQQLDGSGTGRTLFCFRDISSVFQIRSFLGGTENNSEIALGVNAVSFGIATWDTTTLRWFVNETTGTTATPTAESATGGFNIGVNKGVSGNWLEADIFDILIYEKELTPIERGELEDYFNVKINGTLNPIFGPFPTFIR